MAHASRSDAAAPPAQARGAAALTGGAGGGSLAAFAPTLREPYRTLVMIAAPGGAAVVQLVWPRTQAGIVWLLVESSLSCKRRYLRWKLDRAIADLERQRRERTISPDLRRLADLILPASRRPRA